MPLPRTDPSTAQRRYNVNLPLNRVASTTLSSTVVGSGSRQDSGTSFPPGTILNRLSDEQANLEFNARQAKLNSSTASSNLSPKQGHHNFDSKTSINLQNSSQNLLYPNQPNGLNIHPQNHRLSAVQLHPSPSLNPSLAQLNQSSPQLNTQPPQLLHQPRLQYGLSVQLQKREESTSATPTTLRLDSEATDSSELSPNSDATPPTHLHRHEPTPDSDATWGDANGRGPDWRQLE
ncbi:unnamed protein product [Bursaphelenchus okinawaensis]|uniref:Uncharacterized protein n=1 Tax=Bursaphelenchus okinawaensis TaxID=465554 RepID=A0A811KZG4_9BILA|nr:unnamed protein product [Bursaphelenchus okinawaensis]CAG9114307.1 unnamed protein product [Bursaphelenchus okinawaensis]